MRLDAPISVSVVVPVYYGEVYLPVLVEHLEMVRGDWRVRSAPMDLSEVIFVDDSAVDGSPAILDRLAKEHNWITVIHMMRNFGQHAATIAGVLHSSGDWVVTMDEDLQHPPAEIENLLKQAVLDGADIVYGRSAGAVHEARSRDWASKGFKRLMVFLTGNSSIAYLAVSGCCVALSPGRHLVFARTRPILTSPCHGLQSACKFILSSLRISAL